MSKLICSSILLLVIFAGCGKTQLLMLYKKPVFNYKSLLGRSIFIAPAINTTGNTELNNAESIFIQQVTGKIKKARIVAPLQTFKLLNEKGLQRAYTRLRKGLVGQHIVDKKSLKQLHQGLGKGYFLFIKILAFNERREIKQSCLFPDMYSEERSVRAFLSGSVTIIDLHQGAIVFDSLHKVEYVYNRGTTDSLYIVETGKKAVVKKCLGMLYRDIIHNFPKKGEKEMITPASALYGWHIKAECVSGNCVNGTGVLLYDNGDRYSGTFEKGNRQGSGEYTWKNGQKYTGSWKDDKKHGRGMVYGSKGELVRKGIWKNDRFIRGVK